MKTDEIIEVLGKEKDMAHARFISTGCTMLDLVVGGGVGMGFLAGTMVNVAGDRSSGKTMLAVEMMANAMHRYKKKIHNFYDSCELGNTFDSVKLFGVDVMPAVRKIGNREVGDSETVEDMDGKVGLFCDQIKDGELGLYVVDSLDGLSTLDKEEAAEKRTAQIKAGKEVTTDGSYDTSISKFLSQHFFKTKMAKLMNTDTLLVILSQIRDKIGGPAFGEKSEVNAGKALEFYAHTRLWLTTIAKIKRNGLIVGAVVKAATKKSKTPRPFRECLYVVYFDFGLDDLTSNICFLFDLLDPKTGHFLPSSKMIPWDLRKEKNKANVIEWLERIGRLTQAKKDKKEFDGKAFTNEWLDNWIAEDPECVAGFKEEFGETFTLDEMIVKADTDSALRKEIRRRVIEKWEAREEEARTKRPRKYSEEE